MIALEYVASKQSLGGVAPENYMICKCRDKRNTMIKKGQCNPLHSDEFSHACNEYGIANFVFYL